MNVQAQQRLRTKQPWSNEGALQPRLSVRAVTKRQQIVLFNLMLGAVREVDFHRPLRRPIFIFGKDGLGRTVAFNLLFSIGCAVLRAGRRRALWTTETRGLNPDTSESVLPLM